MAVIRDGDGLAQQQLNLARQATQAHSARLAGVVTSVGASTCDVLIDGDSIPTPKVPFTGGTPRAGQRVQVNRLETGYEAVTPTVKAASDRGVGLVINQQSGGSGASAYPLHHAASHYYPGGADAIAPANIGAATPADIAAAIATHLANTDPHTGYLLANGTRPMAGDLTTHHLKAGLPNTYDIGEALLPYRKGYISEMDTVRYIESAVPVFSGIMMVPTLSGTLDHLVLAADTTVNFGQAMTAGHIVMLSSAGQVEYMLLGALSTGTLYSVTRNLDGSGANDWPDGTVWVDLGINGTGRIVLDASTGKPKFSILLQGNAYNVVTEVLRAGNMNGAFGVATDLYGLGVGNYSAGNYMLYDTAGGLKILAGGNSVLLDGTGLSIVQGTGTANKIRWKDGSGSVATLHTAQSAPYNTMVFDVASSGSSGYGSFEFYARDLNGSGAYTLMSIDPDTGIKVGGFNLSPRLLIDGGSLAVGDDVSPGVGEIKASGDIYAAGKGRGLQAQLQDNYIYFLSTPTLNLTTSYQTPNSMTTTRTPSNSETAEVTVQVSIAQFTGTGACQLRDNIQLGIDLYYSSADHYTAERVFYACSVEGSMVITTKAYLSLTAGTAYTIKAVVKNTSGARGVVDFGSFIDVKYRAR